MSHKYSYGYKRNDFVPVTKHLSLDSGLKRDCEIWRGFLIMNGIAVSKSEVVRRLMEVALHKKGYLDDIQTHGEWIWGKLKK